MARERPDVHLTSGEIQAFLDEVLSSEERVAVREHAASCRDCRAELDTWQLLYSELSELSEVSPAPGFSTRVLSALKPAAPETGTEKPFLGWLGQWMAPPAKHIEPERLQDYVESLLPARQMARVSAHIEACGICRSEEARWKELVHGLERLPELAPSEAFPDRVMAQLVIGDLERAPAFSSTRRRILAWAERLIPPTRMAWMVVVSCFAMMPVAVSLAYAVRSNALVAPGHLASFLWWKVSAGVAAWVGAFADGLPESPIAVHAYSIMVALADAPMVTVMVAVSLAAATGLSVWILYRNVMISRIVEGNHV